MTTHERKQEIIKRFTHFSHWDDRYRQLIAYGRKLPPMDPTFKTPQYLVPGCVSKVWLFCEEQGGRLYFQGDSDASITKGIVGVLLYLYSGATPQEITQCSGDFLETIQLQEHLTPNRRNGLAHMIQLIRNYAATHQQK